MKHNKCHLLINRVKKKIAIIYCRITWFRRVLPDFLIIGVSKSGTTSLYNYLIKHPDIFPSLSKEISFFDEDYNNGLSWYRSHFPTFSAKNYRLKHNNKFMTGHACDSFYHPLAPKRIFSTIPNVKMILLLRNPTERAISHYNQSVKKGRESQSFDDAIITQLNDTLAYDNQLLLFENNRTPTINPLNAYLSAGIYFDRLKRFYEIFPKEQILIINSDDLFNEPKKTLEIVTKFLGLANFNLDSYPIFNKSDQNLTIKEDIIERLRKYYKPHNEKLYKLVGMNFKWD